MRRRLRIPDGWRLVWVVSLSAVMLMVFLGWRVYDNIRAQQGLCEKIDRFMVASEAATMRSDQLTQAEKNMRIRFYEDFRNDPPVCRTTP